MSTPTPLDQPFGPEWAALELLCSGRAEAEPERLARVLGAGDLRWGELLEQALRHQLLPMLALHALDAADRSGVRIPGRIAHHLLEVLEANRWHLLVFRREAVRIGAALRARGLRFAASKGITFESTIYGGKGVRVLKDVDFMIAPGDRDVAAAELGRLGYRPGVYDRATKSIVPHPRRQHVIYVMNPDHLPRHARVSDEPGVPYLYVDFANSLTWARSPYEVPVDEALRSCVELPLPDTGAALPCFAPDFQFLFTVLHLFREAWFEQWVEYELDVSLMKFGDVIRLFAAHRDALCGGGGFAALLERHRVVEPIAWVLAHTDRTFGTGMAAALGLQDRVNEERLHAAHSSSGKERRWRGEMRERLWAKDRAALFARADAVTP